MITAALLLCLSPVAYDGDTFRCGASPTRVRLFGVEAEEIRTQTTGAIAAKEVLQTTINGGVICEPLGNNYNRIVARCSSATIPDIGKNLLDQQLVKEWCLYSKNYYGTCQ